MTINKSQRKSLDYVQLYLRKEVFSHDQFKIKEELEVLINYKQKQSLTTRTNVVFI